MFVLTTTLLLTGCTTASRFGYLIPAHNNSDSSKNEVVLLDLFSAEEVGDAEPTLAPQFEQPTPKSPPPGAQGFPGAAELAGVAAKYAIEQVQSELEREAARYEAQFTRRILVDTTQLKGVHYLILSRWVDSRDLHLLDSRIFDEVQRANYNTLKECLLALEKKRAEHYVFGKLSDDSHDKVLENKELAFLYVGRIESHGGGLTGAFTFEPNLLWIWKTKAKVVDFKLQESWKMWQWVGTLFFKTDDKVNCKVQATFRALAQGKNGEVTTVKVDPSDPTVTEQQHSLSKPTAYILDGHNGAWFDAPRYAASGQGKTADVGFLTLEITVSESDASNVRKQLLKGADALDKNKDSLTTSTKKLFE